MNKYAVIVAGGTGARMGNLVPKQFMLLDEKPVLYYSIKSFLEAYAELEVILVLPADHLDTGKRIINNYFDKKNIKIIAGGATRFHSVKNGLSMVDQQSIIFVHDGVRCLVTPALIHRCHDMALSKGSAIPVVRSKDSVRLMQENGNQSYDRNKVLLVQTPQTFHSNVLLPAFQAEYDEDFTDEATVVEASGVNVHLVEGEETNIKITRPVDLLVAEQYLSGNN